MNKEKYSQYIQMS